MYRKVSHQQGVRWGVVSTAKVGLENVIPAMQKCRGVEVRALASRSLPKATEWATRLGIPVVYGSYDELLGDPEIDAVYNPLPNHLHFPVTLAAVSKGKHVLCEKPFAMNAAEAEAVREAAQGVLVGEAFMVRSHPQWIKARELIRAGTLGDVRAVQAFFSYSNIDPTNIRNVPNAGGGALYDIGCYTVAAGRYVFGAEPIRVVALVDRDQNFLTDHMTSVLIDFGDGRHETFSLSTQATAFQRVNIVGTSARLELQAPFTPPQGGATQIYIDQGEQVGGASAVPIPIPEADQYQLLVENFSNAIRLGTGLEFGIDDAVLQMRVLDAILRSETTGSWEAV